MSEQSYLRARVQSLTQAIAATSSTKLKVAWKLDLDATNRRLAELATTSTPAPPPTADRFRDSIGVCTHLAWYGTPTGISPANRQAILDLGVKHLRDGWGPGSPAADDFATELHQTAGVRLTFLCDPHDGPDLNLRVAHLKKLAAAGVLDTIEGPNEWDQISFVLNGVTLRDWMARLIAAVRADPAFANVKLAAPALAQTMDPAPYKQVGLIAGLDYGSTHDYPGDQHQMTDTIAATAQANARIIAGAGKPVIATETGFTTWTVTSNWQPYTAVTEAEQATKTVELYRAHYAAGVYRTFNYNLVSKGTPNTFENGFGLIRPDGSRKPVFDAVRSLLASP